MLGHAFAHSRIGLSFIGAGNRSRKHCSLCYRAERLFAFIISPFLSRTEPNWGSISPYYRSLDSSSPKSTGAFASLPI